MDNHLSNNKNIGCEVYSKFKEIIFFFCPFCNLVGTTIKYFTVRIKWLSQIYCGPINKILFEIGVYLLLTFKRYLNISNNSINKMRGDNMNSPKIVFEIFNNAHLNTCVFINHFGYL